MHKLWIFGDSFSTSHKIAIRAYHEHCETESRKKSWLSSPQNKYIANKYLEEGKIPQHFEDIVANHFGLECGENYNKAGGGFSNYDILETIGKTLPNINEEDFVIIGWSDPSRFRLLNSKSEWEHMHAAGVDLPLEFFNGFKDMTDSFRIALQRLTSLRFINDYNDVEKPFHKTIHELKSWVNLINKALPKNTIHWTPFGGAYFSNRDITDYNLFHYPNPDNGLVNLSIGDETQGKNPDGHYSETGHIKVGKEMCKWFDNPKKLYPYGKRFI